MDLTHQVATDLLAQLRAKPQSEAIASFKADKLDTASGVRSRFAKSVVDEIDSQLVGFQVEALSVSGPDILEPVATCSIRPREP